MNAEQSLVEYARRSHENAERTTNAALRMEQMHGRVERELGEFRRDLRKLTEIVGILTVPPKSPTAAKKYNPTDTGSHMLVPAADLDELLDKRQQREDAHAYRRIGRRIRQVLIAVALGSATFGGEHLLKWLLHW